MINRIRNFCIIAHIDHGKSTLADRLLELTGTIDKRLMQEQILDSNPIERERGITIKLAPVRMLYKARNPNIEIRNNTKLINSNKQNNFEFRASNFEFSNSEYILNLIDTPGHVDFNYEVSRSLAACEGAVLVVDATQGVQAQTLANLNLARRQNLVVIPVINKIDLPNAQINEVKDQIVSLGFKEDEIINISAKIGTNTAEILKAVVERIPSPQGKTDKPLRAMIFSSQYDSHKGVVIFVRIIDGSLATHQEVLFIASDTSIVPIEIGYFTPQMKPTGSLATGEVGFIATGLKDVSLAKVGDTVTASDEFKVPIRQAQGGQSLKFKITPLPGYKEPKPMVFLGLYPIQSDEYPKIREALSKLRLSDSAFSFRSISSQALGNGFHCGFLGLLHAEIVQERLLREFNMSLFATAPNVEYKIKRKGESLGSARDKRGKGSDAELFTYIQSASEYPDPSVIAETLEPIMQLTIFTPKKFIGDVMKLCFQKRGEFVDQKYLASEQVKFTYLMPLSEMIIDFFDQLKSATQGYASLDYEFFDYQTVTLVKLDILVNHETVDAFSQLVVADRSEAYGRDLVDKLKEEIPRQQFSIPIQAAIGGKIIARADVKPFRKDVTKKLYGGDRTRKDKLLDKQRKGKSKMKMIGSVEIPQEAFVKVFSKS